MVWEDGAGLGQQPRRRPARRRLHRRAYELICCDCGDDPDLDYQQVSSQLQRIRGPYPIAAGVEAYEQHAGRHKTRQPARTAGGGRSRRWSRRGCRPLDLAPPKSAINAHGVCQPFRPIYRTDRDRCSLPRQLGCSPPRKAAVVRPGWCISPLYVYGVDPKLSVFLEIKRIPRGRGSSSCQHGGAGRVTIRKSCGPTRVCPGRRHAARSQPHDFRIRTRAQRTDPAYDSGVSASVSACRERSGCPFTHVEGGRPKAQRPEKDREEVLYPAVEITPPSSADVEMPCYRKPRSECRQR